MIIDQRGGRTFLTMDIEEACELIKKLSDQISAHQRMPSGFVATTSMPALLALEPKLCGPAASNPKKATHAPHALVISASPART